MHNPVRDNSELAYLEGKGMPPVTTRLVHKVAGGRTYNLSYELSWKVKTMSQKGVQDSNNSTYAAA